MSGNFSNPANGFVANNQPATAGNGRLQDKIAIVTGASSGIGRAISLAYAAEGAKVVVADLAPTKAGTNETELSTNDLIVQRGGESIFAQLDVTNALQFAEVIKLTVERYNRVDILVNNAGVGPEILDPRPVWETTDKTWNTTIGVNSTGVFNGIRAAAGQMVRQEPHPSGDRGWIINLSSIYGQVAIAGSGAYCASKHLVLGLTKSAALDCAPHRIHVNAICPGYTQTTLTQPLLEGDDAQIKQITAMHPFRGLGRPEDVACAAVVLASDDARWMTGTSITVDGGFVCQ